jgi:glyoxylase-like metal-dependent hydrolase (beta-lactamase superfamily II)
MRNNHHVAGQVLITHAHIDHIAGISSMRREFPGVCVMCSRDEIPLLDQTNLQARMFSLPEPGIPVNDQYIDPVAPLAICGHSMNVLRTPGHSEGSVSFYVEGMVFTGDALFKGTVGRTDLFGGNHSTLIEAIREVLLPLPDETIVYPGHGDSTSIGEEKRTNRYLR